MVLKIAFRNCFRQRRRSVLTLAAMAGGFALCSLSIGISDGTYLGLIEAFTRNRTGHVQIHGKGYLDKPTLYNTIDDPVRLGETVESLDVVEAWTPRVYSPVLAAVDNKTTGARIVGVLPGREARTTRLKLNVSAGRFLTMRSEPEVMLGFGLAESLGATTDDEVILIGQAADGSIANDVYRVVGIVGDGKDPYQRVACYMHLKEAQSFLELGHRVHEMAVVLEDPSASVRTASKLKSLLAGGPVAVSPWQVVERAFYRAMQADVQGMWISLGIINLIVAIGVLNTVLMAIMERTREFGVLRALGTRPAAVFLLILGETACLSVFGVLIGGGLGMICNTILAKHGIVYPTPVEYGGYVFDRLISMVSFRSVWIPAVLTFGTAVLVSLIPATRAARVAPARAMRTH
ncbi:MAG: ABC transporter permease [Gemmatimonadota bacterium]|nr:ABC transporter permease [Gemmatimonadota bacterium]